MPMCVLMQQVHCIEDLQDVEFMNKIIKTLFVMLLLASPGAAWYSLGNAQKTYENVGITCYLGQLFPGQPIYFCMYPDGSMQHSWFNYQYKQMDDYYTGGMTTTYTARIKKE